MFAEAEVFILVSASVKKCKCRGGFACRIGEMVEDRSNTGWELRGGAGAFGGL
jgi:hypothetical protein